MGGGSSSIQSTDDNILVEQLAAFYQADPERAEKILRAGKEKAQEVRMAKSTEMSAAKEKKNDQRQGRRLSARSSRLRFAAETFSAAAAVGNPAMGCAHVLLVRRADFLGWGGGGGGGGGFLRFEDCARRGLHVAAEELGPEARALFVSHRWQDAEGNRPDDPARHLQYRLVARFLERCDEGGAITHLWVDYSSINQDRKEPQDLMDFLRRLDNIGTAICCATVVLLVPRLEGPDRDMAYYTDLEEYMARGWCLMESTTALIMGCKICVVFVCGKKLESAKFKFIAGGLDEDDDVSIDALKGFNEEEERHASIQLGSKVLARSSKSTLRHLRGGGGGNWKEGVVVGVARGAAAAGGAPVYAVDFPRGKEAGLAADRVRPLIDPLAARAGARSFRRQVEAAAAEVDGERTLAATAGKANWRRSADPAAAAELGQAGPAAL